MEEAENFYRPDAHGVRAAVYTLAELRERERLTASIAANLKFISTHSINLEQLERRLAAIATALKRSGSHPGREHQ